jgi:hypothetical protein
VVRACWTYLWWGAEVSRTARPSSRVLSEAIQVIDIPGAGDHDQDQVTDLQINELSQSVTVGSSNELEILCLLLRGLFTSVWDQSAAFTSW